MTTCCWIEALETSRLMAMNSSSLGQRMEVRRAPIRVGVAKGEYLTVESMDRQYNLVRLKGAGEKRVGWEP